MTHTFSISCIGIYWGEFFTRTLPLMFKGKLDEIVAQFDQKTAIPLKQDESLLKRIDTFKIYTWYGKPKSISSIECAKRGWINSNVNQLFCPDCHVFLTVDISDPTAECAQIITDLTEKHKDCLWRNYQSLFQPSQFTRQEFLQLYKQWSITGIPIEIEARNDIDPIAKILPQPVNRNALLLALYHWKPSSNGMQCQDCFRSILWEHVSIIDCVSEHRYLFLT
jgi:hypothetical protein